MAERNPSVAWVLLRTLVFTALVPGTGAVLVPYWLLGSEGKLSGVGFGLLQALGSSAIAFGAAGYFWCAWDFARTGRGTPAPFDAPRFLAARGLYRVVRNPMYASVLLVVFGESLLFESWRLARYAGAGWVFFHFLVMLYEEPTLREKFGESYAKYCKTVPRWVPRLRRHRAS